VLSLAEAATSAELRERGTFVDWDGVPQPAPAPRLSASAVVQRPRSRRCGDTDQILAELGYPADGIRVNAIAPGLIFTDTIRAELPKDKAARVMSQQILSREGEERDIVEALLYLVSPASSFVTGETLRVTGGFVLSV
jgi:hypothetical protein